MSTEQELKDVMDAYSSGKTVQRLVHGKWVDLPAGGLFRRDHTYRVKPPMRDLMWEALAAHKELAEKCDYSEAWAKALSEKSEKSVLDAHFAIYLKTVNNEELTDQVTYIAITAQYALSLVYETLRDSQSNEQKVIDLMAQLQKETL